MRVPFFKPSFYWQTVRIWCLICLYDKSFLGSKGQGWSKINKNSKNYQRNSHNFIKFTMIFESSVIIVRILSTLYQLTFRLKKTIIVNILSTNRCLESLDQLNPLKQTGNFQYFILFKFKWCKIFLWFSSHDDEWWYKKLSIWQCLES